MLDFLKNLVGLDSWASDSDGFKGSVTAQVVIQTRLRISRRKWLSLESVVTSKRTRTKMTGFDEFRYNYERVDDLVEFIDAARDHYTKVEIAKGKFAEIAKRAEEANPDAG